MCILDISQLTDKYGPDTGTWSMHTVGWLELDNVTKAEEMFLYMFRNINGPFKVIALIRNYVITVTGFSSL